MTEQQRSEIERLLRQLMTEKEAAHFWSTPQAFLDGAYPTQHPERTREVLQRIIEGAYR